MVFLQDILILKLTVSAIFCNKTKSNFNNFLNHFYSFQYFAYKFIIYPYHWWTIYKLFLRFYEITLAEYKVIGTFMDQYAGRMGTEVAYGKINFSPWIFTKYFHICQTTFLSNVIEKFWKILSVWFILNILCLSYRAFS